MSSRPPALLHRRLAAVMPSLVQQLTVSWAVKEIVAADECVDLVFPLQRCAGIVLDFREANTSAMRSLLDIPCRRLQEAEKKFGDVFCLAILAEKTVQIFAELQLRGSLSRGVLVPVFTAPAVAPLITALAGLSHVRSQAGMALEGSLTLLDDPAESIIDLVASCPGVGRFHATILSRTPTGSSLGALLAASLDDILRDSCLDPSEALRLMRYIHDPAE